MDLSDIEFPLRRPDGGYLGMTTLEEQEWCKQFTASRYTGEGALVELGAFFGSLSLSLADGLAEAAESGRLTKKQALLESYDLFYWHRSMTTSIKGTPLEGRLKEGDWFFEVFQANTAHRADYINPTWGDLGKKKWEGGPIEFLLLDCLKYDEITNNVMQSFIPATRPGLSRIGHQDYFHFYEWWTHLINFEQRNYLEIEEAVPNSGMLIMKVTGDLREYCHSYNSERDYSKTTPDQIEAAYEWNFSVISPEFHPTLHAARIWAYVWTGQRETARRIYEETKSQYEFAPAYKDLILYCEAEGFPF